MGDYRQPANIYCVIEEEFCQIQIYIKAYLCYDL